MNKKATYIYFDKKRNCFIETILIENINGINPIIRESTNCFISLPYLKEQLKLGKEIYMYYGNGYLGEFHTEEPYGEEKIFLSEYDSHNYDEEELLIDLDKTIKEGATKSKKLVKIGNFYETRNN